MKCPECSAESAVLETRGDDPIRRRRECLGTPAHRFTTEEVEKGELDRLRTVRRLVAELEGSLEELRRNLACLRSVDVDLSTRPAELGD